MQEKQRLLSLRIDVDIIYQDPEFSFTSTPRTRLTQVDVNLLILGAVDRRARHDVHQVFARIERRFSGEAI